MRGGVLLGVLLASTLFAGCVKDDPQDDGPAMPDPAEWSLHVVRMDPEIGCAKNLCRADPDSNHSTEVWNGFGLEALTDDEYNIRQPSVDGDWLVWQGNHHETHPRGDILAMHLPTREVYGVAMGPGHSIRPFLDDDRVVFQYSSVNYTGIAYWEAGTDTVLPIIVEPEGKFYLSDFQGDWIAFGMRGATNASHNGEWVWNIQTGTGYQIYQTPPTLDGSRPAETVQGMGSDLNDEYAFFVLSTDHGEGATPRYTYDLHQFHLATQETKIISLQGIGSGYAVEAGPHLVAVGTSEQGVHLYNPDDETFTLTNVYDYEENRSDCDSLFGKKEWIWLKCGHVTKREFVYYEIPTEAIHVYETNEDFQYLSTTCDGERIVFAGATPTDKWINLYLDEDFLK